MFTEFFTRVVILATEATPPPITFDTNITPDVGAISEGANLAERVAGWILDVTLFGGAAGVVIFGILIIVGLALSAFTDKFGRRVRDFSLKALGYSLASVALAFSFNEVMRAAGVFSTGFRDLLSALLDFVSF